MAASDLSLRWQAQNSLAALYDAKNTQRMPIVISQGSRHHRGGPE